MCAGKKSDDQFHSDYIPTIFSFVKSPEKNSEKDKGSWRSTNLFEI